LVGAFSAINLKNMQELIRVWLDAFLEPAMPITSADIVPFNKARAELTHLADEVRSGHEKILTRNGESYVALVDARKLDYYHQLEREKQAHADAHLSLLNDAIAGLQEIRDGKPGLDLKEVRARAQVRLDKAIAARKAGA
jgi:prevent-host-death family protein